MSTTTVLGLALLTAGIALTATPIPGGFLILAPALRILRRSSQTAARIIDRLRDSHYIMDKIIGRAIGAPATA